MFVQVNHAHYEQRENKYDPTVRFDKGVVLVFPRICSASWRHPRFVWKSWDQNEHDMGCFDALVKSQQPPLRNVTLSSCASWTDSSSHSLGEKGTHARFDCVKPRNHIAARRITPPPRPCFDRYNVLRARTRTLK